METHIVISKDDRIRHRVQTVFSLEFRSHVPSSLVRCDVQEETRGVPDIYVIYLWDLIAEPIAVAYSRVCSPSKSWLYFYEYKKTNQMENIVMANKTRKSGNQMVEKSLMRWGLKKTLLSPCSIDFFHTSLPPSIGTRNCMRQRLEWSKNRRQRCKLRAEMGFIILYFRKYENIIFLY